MIAPHLAASARRLSWFGPALVLTVGLLALQSATPARAYSPLDIHIMAMEQVQQMYDAAITAIDQQTATELSGATGAFSAAGNAGAGQNFVEAVVGAETADDVAEVVDARIQTELGLDPGAPLPDNPEDFPMYPIMSDEGRALIGELYELRNPNSDASENIKALKAARAALQNASDGIGAHLDGLRNDSAPTQQSSLVTPDEIRADGLLAQADEATYFRATTMTGLMSGYVNKSNWDDAFVNFKIDLSAKYSLTETVGGGFGTGFAIFRPGWVQGPWGPEYINCAECWDEFLDDVWEDFGPAAEDYFDSMGLAASLLEAGPARGFPITAVRFQVDTGTSWVKTKLNLKQDQYTTLNGTTTFGYGGGDSIFGGALSFEGSLFGGTPIDIPPKRDFTGAYLNLAGIDLDPTSIKIGSFGQDIDFPTIFVGGNLLGDTGLFGDDDDSGLDPWTTGGIIGDYKLGHSLGGLGWLQGGSYDDEEENSLDNYWMDDWGAYGIGSPYISMGYEMQRRTMTAPVVANDPLYQSRGSWGQNYDDQWAMRYIGLDDLTLQTLLPARATPVTVAVLDTGVDRTHPELIGAIWTNPNEIPRNGKDDDGNGYIDDVFGWNFVDENNRTMDSNGHGTVVAGIIAAWPGNGIGIAGVNPWARIMPLKIADDEGEGTTMKIARAIHYAADNGARVINISSAVGFRSRAIYQAVLYARRRGVIVVAAAGNGGNDIASVSPGGLPGVLTVAATGPNDKRVGFSNYGPAVEIAAPGVDILSLRARNTDLLKLASSSYRAGSAIVGKDKRYYRVNGTSFSAPFVAGVASLLLSLDTKRTPGQVKRMIVHSARDIEAPGWDHLTGYGLLDARAAIKADPDFYAISRIGSVGVVKKDKSAFFAPTGTASADKFKRAWFEVGRGKAPTRWTRAGDDIVKPVNNAVLGLVPVRHFRGGKEWTLRLLVEHENGLKRESRYLVSLQ